MIDLRRLATGGQVVSAALRTDEPATSPGEYEGTVEIADASQLTTSYESMIIVDEGGWSGSFEGVADDGGVASGTFVCSQQAIAPTTTIAIDEGEEVRHDDAYRPRSAHRVPRCAWRHDARPAIHARGNARSKTQRCRTGPARSVRLELGDSWS